MNKIQYLVHTKPHIASLRLQIKGQIFSAYEYRLLPKILSFVIVLSFANFDMASAQIIPDNTLGPESSTVVPNVIVKGQPAVMLDKGAIRGANLFHSFSEFNVTKGESVYFRNPAGIDRIISRVTGKQRSTILGTLGVQGTADLFLINPSGIFFGPQSKLDINGSFLGTTANSLVFDQNIEFSANNPQVPPKLTINVPLGLQLNHQSAEITAQGPGHRLVARDPLFSFARRTGNPEFDLRVTQDKTLALVGGQVQLKGRILTAPGGNIQLGAVKSGFIRMQPTSVGWAFNYKQVQEFGDINLSEQALVDGSGITTASIQAQGHRVSLTGGSVIRSQNLGNQTGRGLVINATESIQLLGTNPQATIRSGIIAESLALGRGSKIVLSTRTLSLKEGSLIFAGTVGPGTGGPLQIDAAESINVVGTSRIDPRLISLLSTGALDSGDSGNAFISTKYLQVKDGGLVTSATLGSGKGGHLTVNVSEQVDLVGVGPALFANSAISASSLATGDAGNLVINTKRLGIRDGARVDASTFASGNAGSATVNATEYIEINGVAPGGRDSSLIISSANLLSPELRRVFQLPPFPTGKAGSVTVTTKELRIANGAMVSVRNDGPGDAGTLKINANKIFLTNEAGITASTISGNGGDIDLQINNELLMRNNSLISATANGPGDGGNINIGAALIVAFSPENSDIVANASSGRGGKISLTTQGLFGLNVRNQQTQFSDITAISKNDPTLNGIVEINNPEVDPSDSLMDLPETIDVPQAVEQGCRAGQSLRNSHFIHTGRGGLPTGPDQLQTAAALWHDLREPQLPSTSAHTRPSATQPIPRQVNKRAMTAQSASSEIREARGWMQDDQGRVVLTAKLPHRSGQSQRRPSSEC